MDSTILLKQLNRLDTQDEELLQKVLESAPFYTERVTGFTQPPKSQARENLDILPPGKTHEDKFVFVIYLSENEEPIGCADLIRGYPSASVATLGLLMLSEKFQDKGLGRLVYQTTERCIVNWGGITKIRLATVSTNGDIHKFWIKMGFNETGERRPYECRNFRAENIIMEKLL